MVRAGWKVVIATLFARSVPNPQGFALACQLDKGLGPAVDYMALRRAEDVAASRALGLADPVHSRLPEAPHRGYGSASALFGPLLPNDGIAGALRDTVGKLIDEHAPDLILAPQAIGGHVDHIQVVEALRSVEPPILWWRDFPYIGRTATPFEPYRDRLQALAEHEIRLDPAAENAKLAGCLAYTSQLGFQFGGPAGLRTKLIAMGAAEHFRGDLPNEFSTLVGASRPRQSAESGTG